MINYYATNSLGQGLAAREKIYSFVLGYFAFFYKEIPLLLFDFSSKEDILSKLSNKILEYFKQYIIDSETTSGEEKNKKHLAKYYLAAIYYYEPNFDFESSNINDIYTLGEVYLVQLVQENINSFIENVRKQTNIEIPSYSESWKKFFFAMLRSEAAQDYLNIIQQPISIPSRQTFEGGGETVKSEIDIAKEIVSFLKKEHNSLPTNFPQNKFVSNRTSYNNSFVPNYKQKIAEGNLWEDAPNMIKFFVRNKKTNELQIIYPSNDQKSIDNLFKSGEITDSDFFVSYYRAFDEEDNFLAFAFPPRIKKYSDDSFYVEPYVFFEFCFEPIYDEIIKLQYAPEINKKTFELLQKANLLKFSKTEAYNFIYALIGTATYGETSLSHTKGDYFISSISEEQFSSLFNLQVKILYLMPHKYINSTFNYKSSNFNAFSPTDQVEGTSFGIRSWPVVNNIDNYDKEDVISLLYNPLTKAEENYLSNLNIAINESLNLGNAYNDFGVLIRTFNPQYHFKNQVYFDKFLNIIDNAQPNTPAGILKNEFLTNLNIDPFDYSQVANKLLSVESARLAQNFIENNVEMFTKGYSQFSKNLLDNLINTIDKIK